MVAENKFIEISKKLEQAVKGFEYAAVIETESAALHQRLFLNGVELREEQNVLL